MAVERSRQEVADIIRDFLDGTGAPWDWDDFSSVGIKDAALERIREIVTDFPVRFPAERAGHYCSAAGLTLLRRIHDELRKPDPDLRQFYDFT